MLAKKDDILLELKKTLATKNAEHALEGQECRACCAPMQQFTIRT